MDGLQTELDVVGMVPGWGEPADGINAGISLLRGNYADAALSALSMIPLAGWLPTAGKWLRRAFKYGDEALDAARYADEVGEWAVMVGDELVEGVGDIAIANPDDFFNSPKMFADAVPEQYYRFFQNNGFNPKPLGSKSSLQGVPFDQGGGFRINWGGDRYLQYHPSISSHHGGAYWKLSSGSTGTLRFDLDGNLLP